MSTSFTSRDAFVTRKSPTLLPELRAEARSAFISATWDVTGGMRATLLRADG